MNSCGTRLDPLTEVVHRHVAPELCTNDTERELMAVLAGEATGQVAKLSAVSRIRAGRLVALLLPHMTDHIGVRAYDGNPTAQPRRERAFIDLVVERLARTSSVVLSGKELNQATRDWKLRRRGT